MKAPASRTGIALVAPLLPLLATCAAPQQRTIEPVATAASPAAGAGGGVDDNGFVLSRSRKNAPNPAAANIQLNIGDRWWKFRGDYLHLSENQVKDRDTAVSEVTAPDKFWDEQSAVETVHVWTALCNECHGGRRKLEDATTMPVPAPGWGKGEGLFFGARRKYADVFHTVYRGGPERNGVQSEMPPWRGKIAKELIWSLLYFLEYQSGGIEGRFPPSLYPRRNAVE